MWFSDKSEELAVLPNMSVRQGKSVHSRKKSNRETEATKSPESQNDTTLQGNKTTNMDKSDMQDIMSQYLPQNNTGRFTIVFTFRLAQIGALEFDAEG